MSAIYKITNKENQKCYIGKTTNFNPIGYCETHLQSAIRGSSPQKYFYNAIRKYGSEKFSIEILVQGKFNKHLLNDLEKHFIRVYNSNDFQYGYNLTSGGDGGNCGNQFTKYHKEGIKPPSELNGMFGKKHSKITIDHFCFIHSNISDETRQKMSNSAIKRFLNSKNPMYGRKHSEKTKQLIKKTKKENPFLWTEEKKQQISLARKGKSNYQYLLEQFGEKIAVQKEIDRGKKISESKQNISDEYKQKLSIAAKNRKKLTCPHCQKIIVVSLAHRWHFDNCKNLKKEI